VENIPADRRQSPFKPVRNAPSLLRSINFGALDPLSTSPFDLRCCSRGVFRFLVSYPFYGDYTAFSSPFRYGLQSYRRVSGPVNILSPHSFLPTEILPLSFLSWGRRCFIALPLFLLKLYFCTTLVCPSSYTPSLSPIFSPPLCIDRLHHHFPPPSPSLSHPVILAEPSTSHS